MFNQSQDIWLEYKFTFPELVTVFEEYLIYDSINMIGAVGGTLSLCIGFSFTNIIKHLLELLQKFITFVENRLKLRK